MPTEKPADRGDIRPYSPARYVIRVGSDWAPVRASTIWPIADVLEPGRDVEAVPAAAGTPGGAVTVLDLVDSGVFVPPRPRRRRDRLVSSRAVFYQAANA